MPPPRGQQPSPRWLYEPLPVCPGRDRFPLEQEQAGVGCGCTFEFPACSRAELELLSLCLNGSVQFPLPSAGTCTGTATAGSWLSWAAWGLCRGQDRAWCLTSLSWWHWQEGAGCPGLLQARQGGCPGSPPSSFPLPSQAQPARAAEKPQAVSEQSLCHPSLRSLNKRQMAEPRERSLPKTFAVCLFVSYAPESS